MIRRILLLLATTAGVLLLAPADVAMAGPCGEVRYSGQERPGAEEPPPVNPFEPKAADPACGRAARTGSVATGLAAAAAAATALVTRFVRGGRAQPAVQPATRPAPAPPPVPAPAAVPQLHGGNATHALFQRMFPQLTQRNIGFPSGAREWTNNCQSCCVTAELILRGADAGAIPRYGFATPGDIFGTGSWHQRLADGVGVRADGWQAIGGPAAIAYDLAAAGDGARAIVHGAMIDSTGTPVSHVFNAVNVGGTVCFVDLQTGTWAWTAPYHWSEMLRTN